MDFTFGTQSAWSARQAERDQHNLQIELQLQQARAEELEQLLSTLRTMSGLSTGGDIQVFAAACCLIVNDLL